MNGSIGRWRALISVAVVAVAGCGKSESAPAEGVEQTPQALTAGVDFTVSAVSGPASATLNQTFKASVTVCNPGTVSESTEVALYLSSDAAITSGDRQVARVLSAPLASGQCQTLSLSGPASVPTEGPWYLGALADPSNVHAETSESNNARAGSRMGVGSRPDFIIAAVSGPPSHDPDGYGFPVSVQVCNQGTVAGSTSVEVYLSADESIVVPATPGPTTDDRVAQLTTGTLQPGQCQTQSVRGFPQSSPFQKPYYLGAVADPRAGSSELIENNNTAVGNLMNLGEGTDFVITAVTGPTGVQQGQQFATSVTVCNQGNRMDWPVVDIYLSANKVITPPPGTSTTPTDILVGRTEPRALGPDQCNTFEVRRYNWTAAAGAYYLGAAIVSSGNNHPEMNTENNTRVGARIGVGLKPDFAITLVTGPTSVSLGQPLTGVLTVCNQGTASDSTEVSLLLSPDATLGASASATDVLVGTGQSGPLAPGECRAVAVSGSAQVPFQGGWYLDGRVDANNQRAELVEDNNVRLGSRVGVGTGPDFVVTAVSGPASVTVGQTLTGSVTVCNQGTGSDSTEVALYLSPDKTVVVPETPTPYTDQQVARTPTGPLAAGQCRTLSLSGSAWVSEQGGYSLGAVIDPYAARPELLEDNNARVATSRVGVGSMPDFTITSVTTPPSLERGERFITTVRVCNQGTVARDANVDVYTSEDATLVVPTSTDDFYTDRLAGSTWVRELAPGQCESLSIEGWPDANNTGPHYIAAIIDPPNAWGSHSSELLEDNNIKVGPRVGLGAGPELVITAVSGPTSAQQGQALTGSVTVCNQGTREGRGDVKLYLSSDAVIAPAGGSIEPFDTLVGYGYTFDLYPTECQTLSVSGSASLPDGVYHLGAAIKSTSQTAELITDNNTLAGNRIGIGVKADFVVTAVTGPTSVNVGQTLTGSATVCNQGTASGSVDVALYLSSNTTLTPPGVPNQPADPFVGSGSTSVLAPGACQKLTVSGPAQVPEQGAYYLAALVDPGHTSAELIDDNNAKVGSRIGVGARSDFVVTAVTGPASVQQGQTLTSSVTVCNHGTVSDNAEVGLYLSLDSTLVVPDASSPTADVPLARVLSNTLAPAQCQTLSLSGPAGVPTQGAWYLGARVDPGNLRAELQEDNNVRLRTEGRVGVGAMPDFVVTAVSGPASYRRSEQLIASLTVCNRGTVAGETEVSAYLSRDTTFVPLTGPYASPDAYTDSPIQSVPTGLLQPAQCATLPVSGNPGLYSFERPYYLGAFIDPNTRVSELIEDNNTKVGHTVYVQP